MSGTAAQIEDGISRGARDCTATARDGILRGREGDVGSRPSSTAWSAACSGSISAGSHTAGTARRGAAPPGGRARSGPRTSSSATASPTER